MSSAHFETSRLNNELTIVEATNRQPPDLQHLTSVYLALLISGGQIGLPIVVLTASICKRVTWHPTIINFCVTWILYSIIYCLCVYTGASEHSSICMVQASMIQGAAPMAVVAALQIVLHAWSTLQCLQCPFSFRIPRMLYLFLMLGTPYLVFAAFSVGAGTLVMSQSQSVYSNGLYCIIQLGRPAVVVPSFCAAVMVIILTLEAITTMQYYCQWRMIKVSFPLATRTPSLSVCFRIGLFCLYSCVTLTSAILFLSDVRTGVTYMLPAALPLGALIVVGLQKGVLSLWVTLRGRKQSGSSFELELPSARGASGSESRSTLASIDHSEETATELNVPV